MPPKKTSTSVGFLKLKRNKGSIFMSVDYPLDMDAVRSTLLKIITSAPEDTQKMIAGEGVNVSDLSVDRIEFGRITEVKGETAQIVKLEEDDQDVQDKVLVWRISGEEFNVEEYPDDEEEQEVDGP